MDQIWGAAQAHANEVLPHDNTNATAWKRLGIRREFLLALPIEEKRVVLSDPFSTGIETGGRTPLEHQRHVGGGSEERIVHRALEAVLDVRFAMTD